MTLLRLATLTAAAFLAIGSAAAIADETYSRASFYEHGVGVSYIAFSPDGGRIAFATKGREVRIRETGAGKTIATLAVPSTLANDDDLLQFVAFSPDGLRLVTASREGKARVWDIAGGRELVALEHPPIVTSAVFSPDGSRLFTVSVDRMVRIWSIADGRQVAALNHSARVDFAVLSPDGKRLVTASVDDKAHLWDAGAARGAAREIAVLGTHGQSVRDIRFSADGTRVVTASSDGTARIWETARGREALVLRHASPVYSAAFSPDGSRVVTAAGNEAHVFDAATGRETAVLKGHPHNVLVARFTPDGSRIVTGAGNEARVFDAATGSETAVLTGHLDKVHFVAFSADGQRILTLGGAQGIVWAKRMAARLPDGVAGLWFNDIGTAEKPLPPEIARARCVALPIKVNGDGLVVFFEGTNVDPPRAVVHMRCASDLTCQVYFGPPQQKSEPIGDGKITIADKTREVCLTGQCRVIGRCPALVWTDDERKSGFAARWEAEVLAGGK